MATENEIELESRKRHLLEDPAVQAILEEDRKRRKLPCEDARSPFLEETFTPNCPVHGLMHLPAFVKTIVDTPLFQRMRHIKQLGLCSLVFPGAKHDRFFHSIGTAYLAYNLMKDLRFSQPELAILDRDVVCVVAAALMHDLGHPAYSHMFELFMASLGHTSWTHEQASLILVREVLKTVNLNLKDDVEGDDVAFICELIDPPKKDLIKFLDDLAQTKLDSDTLNQKWSSIMKGRRADKAWMYEIVSNYRTGIDVDKMDYFRRDAYFLGIQRQFDHDRYLKSLRVIRDFQGITTLSPPEKSKDDIRENLCELRKTLHRTAYQHKTVKKLEAHMVDILKVCEKTIKVKGKDGTRMSIAEAAVSLDPVAYAKLTDSFFETRLLENEEAALESACESYKKHFMDRKLMRNIIMWEVPTHLEDPGVKDLPPPKTFVKKVLELSTRQVPEEELHCVLSKLHYGLGNEDPVKKVVFHDKEFKPRLFDVDYDANPLRRKLFLFWNPASVDDNHLETMARLNAAATEYLESFLRADPVSTPASPQKRGRPSLSSEDVQEPTSERPPIADVKPRRRQRLLRAQSSCPANTELFERRSVA